MTDIDKFKPCLVKITGTVSQTENLYSLLKTRKHSISHQTLPTFKEHCAFVKRHPYRAWYLIKVENKFIGSAYVGLDNGIGISLNNLSECWIQDTIALVLKKHKPLPGIKSVRADTFHINVNPKNKKLIAALKKLGLMHIQSSFTFDSLIQQK